jgi:transcriptional regulator with XRE-family HTH domain
MWMFHATVTFMDSSVHLKELGEFLKARRAELSPRTVGLPETGVPRRVPGLRRDEVARLAGLSSLHYTRLEQGRVGPSAAVLATLVRVLHLNDEQRDHLFELAGKLGGKVCRRPKQKVQPQVQRFLDDIPFTPALVLGRYMDVLAWNSLAAALFTDFSLLPGKKRNFIRLLFTEPAVRALYLDWERVAHACVTQLRMEGAKCPGDAQPAELVGELSVVDAHFRRWWGAEHTTALSVGTQTLRHPLVGEITLDWDSFTCTTDAEQQLVIWTAEPGTASHDSLRLLSAWTAQPAARASDAP